jgi:hypothetical protein
MRPRRLLLVAGILLFAYAVVVGLLVRHAAESVRDGVHELRAARDELTVRDLSQGAGIDQLRKAADLFGKAHDDLSSPVLAPVRILPFVGRQVRSASALSGAAHEAVDLGADILRDVHALIEPGLPPGPARVDALRESARIAAQGRDLLHQIDLGPDDALVGPLADARDRFASELADVENAMGVAADGASSMAKVMQGPTTWLLLAANNGEMRAGSGMFLSATTVHFADGRMSLSDVRSLADMVLPQPVAVTDADLLARWGWSGLDRDFRNVALTPRFPASAEQAARMWVAATGEKIDGVVALDVAGLAAFLQALGPVEVDGVRLDAGGVTQYLLHDQYIGATDDTQERRDRLGRIARTIFERINQPGVDLPSVAQSVRDATQGRHLMVWSADAALQSVWERAEVAGALHPESVLVALSNRGGNKLDQHVRVTAHLETTAGNDGTDVTVRLRVTNSLPAGEPPYVVGGNGSYSGFLTVDLPRDATGVTLEGGAQLAALGSDGGVSQVIGRVVLIEQGATLEATLRFHLAAGLSELRIEPSARLPALTWDWDAVTWQDGESKVVRFSDPGKVADALLPG